METDYQAIEHLDFNLNERPTRVGYKITDGKTQKTEEKDCTNPASIVTIRSCCGLMMHYCMGCYNEICKFHARQPVTLHNGHDVDGVPFSQIEFLK